MTSGQRKAPAADEDTKLPAMMAPQPELVHPNTTEDGQVNYFTAIGRLRSEPHPLDSQRFLQTVPLTQMPLWVKQALARPPSGPAPPPPQPTKRESSRSSKAPKVAPPSHSSSTPEIELCEVASSSTAEPAFGTRAAAAGSDVHHAETANDADVSEADSSQQVLMKDDSPSAVEDYVLCMHCSKSRPTPFSAPFGVQCFT